MNYTTLLTQKNGTSWRAVVPGLPECVAEAPTREEVLAKIQECIIEVVSHSEVIQLQVPVTPKTTNGQILQASQTPWAWFGAFADDPMWGQIFDEIERERNMHLIGN
jgi:predicted RNase H-like HicB family nuclease